VAALSLAASASPAGAVTIGQIPETDPGSGCTSSLYDFIQFTTSGNSYVVPNTGGVTQWTLTSWSHFATTGDGQMLKMKVFRKVGEPNTYQAVVHDGPRNLAPGVVNTFTTSLAVRAGDILGNNSANAGEVFNACLFDHPGPDVLDEHRERPGDLADGQSGAFDLTDNYYVNVSAEVTPVNTFTLGAITRNKKKGTATESATVPNPGSLTVSGNGVKAAGAGKAVSVTAAGTVQLPIRAKGKKKKKLNTKGKVKVRPTITYTPIGGNPSSQSIKVKLKKKLKKR